MPRIKLTVSEEVLETAKLSSRAFDPDMGGYEAFQLVEEDGRYSYTVDVSEEFYQAFISFKSYPILLAQSIDRDFDNRFPDSPRPSFIEVTAFCDSVEIQVLPPIMFATEQENDN